MKRLQIKGKVVFHNLEMGIWGIEDEKGNQWRPINMPEQLKLDGKAVDVVLEEVEDAVSISMWGVPVKVISFQTFTP